MNSKIVKHMAAAAAAAVVAGAANAAVVTWNINMVVPANIDGLYVNVEAQTSGSTGGAVAGWDINPYGATSLYFYNSVGGGVMRYPGVTTGSAGSLAQGTSVGGTASYGSGAVTFGATAGNWTLNASNYFGFKFVAADGLTHFGFGRMDVGAAAATRTLAFVAYETVANTAISVTPAPGAIALLGLAGLAGRRRRTA